MPATAQNAIAAIGIDIGKNSFHIFGLDDRGAILSDEARRPRHEPGSTGSGLLMAALTRAASEVVAQPSGGTVCQHA
jgi:hypothetical protein